jgi:hypothetical protein
MAFHIELRVNLVKTLQVPIFYSSYLNRQYDYKGYQKVKGSHTINYSKSTPILLMKPH